MKYTKDNVFGVKFTYNDISYHVDNYDSKYNKTWKHYDMSTIADNFNKGIWKVIETFYEIY